MAWSTAEVARMSGVSSRTLRHYDAIGLLRPIGVRSNGHREYGRAELLRLQEILVLRELGLPLTDIGAVVDDRRDRVDALRGHLARLRTERDRLDRVVATVARTLRDLEEGAAGAREGVPVSDHLPENLFEGFDPARFDDEARERWPEQWAASQRYVNTLTPADTERLQRDQTAAMRRMAAHREAGRAVDDPAVQAEVDAAYRQVTQLWGSAPPAPAWRALGRMYVDDERFTATYDRVAPGLAAYYRDAMAVYADALG